MSTGKKCELLAGAPLWNEGRIIRCDDMSSCWLVVHASLAVMITISYYLKNILSSLMVCE